MIHFTIIPSLVSNKIQMLRFFCPARLEIESEHQYLGGLYYFSIKSEKSNSLIKNPARIDGI